MKKVIISVVVMSFVFALFSANSFTISGSSSGTAYANDLLSQNNNPELPSVLKKVEYSPKSGQDDITIFVDNYKSYSIKRLSGPERIVVDFPDTQASASQQKIDINSARVKDVRYAHYGTSIARVVLDTNGQQQYQVIAQKNKLVVRITSPMFKDIEYYSNGKEARLTLPEVQLTKGKQNPQKLYTESYDTTGNKYTMTFPANLAGLENEEIKVNDDLMDSILITNNRKAQTTSITFNAKSKLSYNAVTSSEFNNATVIAFKTSSPEKTPSPDTTIGTPGGNRLSIKCLPKGSQDEVTISLSDYKGYNISRLTDPERIIIDIPNTNVPVQQQKIDINSSFVKTVRYAQYNGNAARIVLDVSGQPNYSVSEKKGQLILNVANPPYKNVVYHNNSDRLGFILSGSALTDGGSVLKKLYSEKYDSTGKVYTITFPSKLGNLGSGMLNINDSLLNSVEITSDKASQQTTMVFKAKDKLFYEIVARPDTNDTAVTIFKPASKADKLVVIDAGHGGVESGAVYSGTYEKNLNLDIALRLNALLTAKKVNTYMIRENDSFVGLYERADIANDMNATLFISVHNNATGDPGFGGTMTLYYPPSSKDTGFTGKTFAQIIQNKLLSTLKTADRKIVERPNLVVLNSTDMPSALAEVAFMTNKQDMNNLLTPDFRQKAAQALCDAVLQALQQSK